MPANPKFTEEQIRDFIWAVQSGNDTRVQQHLSEYPDIVNERDVYGDTALPTAVRYKRVAVAILLLEHGAKQNTGDPRNAEILLAVEFGQKKLVEALLKHGADPHLKNFHDLSTLSLAARDGRAEIVRLLLDAGLDVNECWHHQFTPLYFAARGGHHECVALLLERGADINQRNDWGYTALIIAAENGHRAVVETLMRAGADPEIKDAHERTAEMCALAYGYTVTGQFIAEMQEKMLKEKHDAQMATLANFKAKSPPKINLKKSPKP